MTVGAWTIGRIRGIPIRMHVSLLLVVPLLGVAFSGHFAAVGRRHPMLLPPIAWGLLVAVVLFASVLLHELAHALVALRHGGRVSGITLLFIGGVSELGGDPMRPRAEALVALAGPVVSLVLAAALWGLGAAARPAADLSAALILSGLLNGVLGIFNLVPAFPMDGGRVLRAALAPRLGRLRATRAAATVGRVLAVAIGLAGLQFHDLFAVLVAAFIFVGAGREAAGVALEQEIAGLTVGDVIAAAPALILPDYLPVLVAAERFRAARADAAVVVSPDGTPLGAVGIGELRGGVVADAPSAHVGVVRVSDELRPALQRLLEARAQALAVVDANGAPRGLLRRGDVEREVLLRRRARLVQT